MQAKSNRAAILFLTIFYIGRMPVTGGLFTTIISVLLYEIPVLIFFDAEIIPYLFLFSAFSLSIIYILLKQELFESLTQKELAVTRVISVWIALFSPLNTYSIYWCAAIAVILELLSRWELLQKSAQKAFEGIPEHRIALYTSIFFGVITFFVVHILYAGYRILPVLYLFFSTART